MIRRALVVAALCVPLASFDVRAQPSGPRNVQRREQLERQLRRRLWRIAQERIGLTNEQMSRLEATSQRFDPRRRALVAQEREQRAILRAQILAAGRADQGRISAALDRLLDLQRARLDLQREEQREFAAFMSPLQRAKFAALQEQVRRRADALRGQRPDSLPRPRAR